jgi:two-component system, sensor histidine kinase and response regulator
MTTIVVIEDDAQILDAIIKILTMHSFRVYGTANGYEGIAMTREHHPDLVISDIMMPALNGYDVLHELRSDPATTAIPLIFLSGLGDPTHIREGMKRGADDYLAKPFSVTDLLDAVNSRLDRQNVIVEQFDTKLNVLRKNIAYALPHELRTPLNVIMGYADLLMTNEGDYNPDDVRMVAASIMQGSTRLQRIIENYLVYAQIELVATDSAQLHALRNHITGNVADIIGDESEQKAAAWMRDRDLTLELTDRVLRIPENDLRKITGELVDNAFKFSERGTKVGVRTLIEDGQYVLYIRDHGRGMSEEQMKDLGAYMQFDRALHEQQGLGLGFFLAKRLAELHGGHLTLKSRPDQGTLVTVSFPLY